MCFSYSDPAQPPNHASFHTLESKGRCLKRAGPECHCASRGYSCSRWLIGCYVSTLEIRESSTISHWKESNEDISAKKKKGAQYLFPTAQEALGERKKTPLYPQLRQMLQTVSWHGKQHTWGYLLSIFLQSMHVLILDWSRTDVCA